MCKRINVGDADLDSSIILRREGSDCTELTDILGKLSESTKKQLKEDINGYNLKVYLPEFTGTEKQVKYCTDIIRQNLMRFVVAVENMIPTQENLNKIVFEELGKIYKDPEYNRNKLIAEMIKNSDFYSDILKMSTCAAVINKYK